MGPLSSLSRDALLRQSSVGTSRAVRTDKRCVVQGGAPPWRWEMRRFSVPLAVLALVGCGSPRSVPPVAVAPSSDELSITIERVPAGWLIHTNRRASVAMFEILPNRGVGLLFPDAAEAESWVEAGSTRITTHAGGVVIGRHRAAYLPVPGTVGLWGRDREAVEDLYEGNTPRTVVAIACECTLRLSDLAEGDGPSRLLGPFAAVTAGSATPRLISAVLPSPDVMYGATFAYPRREGSIR